AEPCRAKVRPLRPRRSYFAPAEARARRAWVEAPGTAPGSDGFITTAVYRHSRVSPAPEIYEEKVTEGRVRDEPIFQALIRTHHVLADRPKCKTGKLEMRPRKRNSDQRNREQQRCNQMTAREPPAGQQ